MILTDQEFSDFNIDATIIDALKSNNIQHPSKTQAEVLPLALEGKDVLVRAKTGSGKTYAFCLPLVQKVISNHSAEGPLGLILAPTRELCAQIEQVLSVLLDFCENKIDVFCVSGARNVKVEVPRLKEKPLVLIGTPARICNHVQKGNLTLINLQILCIDEADLILSFGYEDDMKMITQNLPPKPCQCILTSATLSEDILKLKTLLMHDPVVVKIEENEESLKKLSEFYSMAEESEKFLILFGLVKLKLVKGKVLIFVNSLNRGYKVKLFLEKFSVPVGVLNNELPYNTRMNVINQFNSGVLDYLIATDSSVEVEEKIEEEAQIDAFLEEESDSEEKETEELGKRKRSPSPERARKRQKFSGSKYGVHRGVDFREVAAVVNLDFPPSELNYTHRVGRTARGGLFGLAISFVNRTENKQFQEIQAAKRKNGLGPGHDIQPLHLTADMLKPFIYRVESVLDECTKKKIKEIRLREIKLEMMNSKKIKQRLLGSREYELLQHDRLLLKSEVDKSLGKIPSYLRDQLPFTIDDEDINYQTLTGSKVNPQKFHQKKNRRKKQKGKKKRRKRNDPLKNFGR